VSHVTYPIGTQVYTPGEVAAAAGLDESVVRAAVGTAAFVGHAEAVDLALRLRRGARLDAVLNPVEPPEPFAGIGLTSRNPYRFPFAVSGTLHMLFVSAAILLGSFQVAPAARMAFSGPATDEARLVFLNLPGPGGGGGGGGRREPAPASKAMRAGEHRTSSPLPEVAPPPPPQPPVAPPPLSGESFPVLNAPVMPAPADPTQRDGVLDSASVRESRGPGTLDGAGTGAGHGVGSGTGSGIGEGSGGGTGGGPFRPGAGITPPRILHEVKATYTEEARRAGITGQVDLEVVVQRTGSVGSIRLVRGLGAGLDQRAIDAVRQWSFAPATRQGTPVAVIVEVSVEFALR
jgi:TonB family protein